MIHAIVMAGGSGTRFWPQSRRLLPKQLLALAGDRALIRSTVDRIKGWIASDKTWIVTNSAQVDATRAKLPELRLEQFIVEPCARNTAPCIGLAAVRLLAHDPDATMLVMPADHIIDNTAAFRATVESAAKLIEQQPDSLVLFGAKPNYPATAFGYIEMDSKAESTSNDAARVQAFKEKPDLATAEEYLWQGKYLWNCGIFVWKARRILELIQEFEPEIHRRLMRIQAAKPAEFESVLATEFAAMKGISIDYAVLERAANVRVIPATFDWDDVGSWQAVARRDGANNDGNVVKGPFVGLETKNCIVRTTDDHLIATLGLENCIVVHTPDATLVAKADDEEAIRRLVKLIEERGYDRFL